MSRLQAGPARRTIALHLQFIGVRPMKTSSIPAVRVSPALREAAEDLLDQGETLSAFVEESVRRNIELRRVQRLFLERGLESARKARDSGTYVPARDVLQKLSARLDQARAEHDAAE